MPVRWLLAVALPALLLGAAALGLWWAGSQTASPSSTPIAPVTGAVAWDVVLAELDARRSAAYASGDVSVLGQVYAPRSPALAADTAQLAALADAGMVAHGLRLTLVSTAVEDTGPGRVVLRVVDRIGPYELRDRHGTVAARRGGRAELGWLVTLVPADTPPGEWRIASVQPI